MKNQTKYIITGLLVLSLMRLSLIAAETNSPAIEPSPNKPKTFFLWCGVVASALFVIYAIDKCRIAAGLTNAPTPPINGTNSQQIVFSGPKDLTPPGGGGTNVVVIDNDSYPTGKVVIFPTATLLATNNEDSAASLWDISTNGWTDSQGNPYTWLYITHTDPAGPHIQTSTNLVNWSDAYYNTTIWFSSSAIPDPDAQYVTNMLTVVSDSNGVPLLTNFSPISASSGTVNMGVPITAPRQFFRGVVP